MLYTRRSREARGCRGTGRAPWLWGNWSGSRNLKPWNKGELEAPRGKGENKNFVSDALEDGKSMEWLNKGVMSSEWWVKMIWESEVAGIKNREEEMTVIKVQNVQALSQYFGSIGRGWSSRHCAGSSGKIRLELDLCTQGELLGLHLPGVISYDSFLLRLGY